MSNSSQGQVHLILGGARSGKSRLAEKLALEAGKPVVYVATAQAKDGEMAERISHHKSRRPCDWQCIEEPMNLARLVEEFKQQDAVMLVDCLTLWLTNWLLEGEVSSWLEHKADFFSELEQLTQHGKLTLILVSNEVGQGIVPMGAINRLFVDEAGRLHQELAERADRVDFVMAGLALNLKPAGLSL